MRGADKIGAYFAVAALMALGCGANTPPARFPAPAAAATILRADRGVADDASTQRCDERVPALTAYDAMESGRVFSLLVVEKNGNWVPASPLRSPLHHASALVWHDGSSLLEGQRGTGKALTVIATALGRTELRADPERRLWFATYAARVECVRAARP